MQILGYTIHHFLDGFFSVRESKWNMTTQLRSGGFSEPKSTLCDMENDINETINLYMKYIEVVNDFTNLLEEAKKN